MKQGVKYLKDGAVQLTPPLVANLASEEVIESVNIPLASYPDTIKDVVPLIDEEKPKRPK